MASAIFIFSSFSGFGLQLKKKILGKEDYWICSSICRALCDLSVGYCNITVIRMKKKKKNFHILVLVLFSSVDWEGNCLLYFE